MRISFLIKTLVLSLTLTSVIHAQEAMDLKECISYALENNTELKKSELDREKSMQARREIIGNLLPQVNGSGSMNYNLKKAKFIMPNFINEMMPAAAQDPDAPKYMTIEMGTNYSAGLAASLNQQVLNFSLFNAIDIAKTAESMAELGVESTEEDIISQTASLYYAIQSTEYAEAQFSESMDLIEEMLKSLEVSLQNGLVRKVDVDRLKINRVNMEAQKRAIANAVQVQKNLLKLQMGMDMDEELELPTLNFEAIEQAAVTKAETPFDPGKLTPFRIVKEQMQMSELQLKSVKYEFLPSLSLGLNYQHNFVSDQFFTGDTYYNYPSSMVGLNLRVPIFAGMTRDARMKEAKIEIEKTSHDVRMLDQSLRMAYRNALLKQEDSRRTIEAQRENKKLAEDVYRISEANYQEGLASMSDVLNANSSLIQAQVSYADALNNYMKSHLELLKASGSIRDLLQ